MATALVCLFVGGTASAQDTASTDPFCVVVLRPDADFARIEYVIDEEPTAEQRRSTFAFIDVDGDGALSAAEMARYERMTTQSFDNATHLGPLAITLQAGAPYLNARTQHPVVATSWNRVGQTGYGSVPIDPATATRETLQTQEMREYWFLGETGRASTFTLRGGAQENTSVTPDYEDLPRPVIEFVVVEAPKGWRVARVEGHSYNGSFVLEPDRRVVEVPAFDLQRPYEIRFLNPELDKELGKIDGVPGPGFLLVAGALAAAVLVARRARFK